MRVELLFAILAVLWGQIPIQVQAADNAQIPVMVDGREFGSWEEFFQSDYFKLSGRRCGTPELSEEDAPQAPGDCASNSTNGDSLENYAPGTLWEIPIVVHIIRNTAGTQGEISDALVASQIDVLNEDFRAMAGTPGAPGTDVTLQFALATMDPDGNPTTGITRSNNDTWFNDGGAYYNTLAWDPHNYCNIYTNLASGALGYVPALPQNGIVGSNADRIVIYWRAFGRPSSFPPYHLGRTATHEMGHYVGLYHTFQSGCGLPDPPGCYTSGDRICDTPGQTGPHGGCPIGLDDCDAGTPDPIHNYMEYTDDVCMDNFTPQQARRERCTLIHYRPRIYSEVTLAVAPSSSPKVGSMLGLNRPNPFNPTTELTFELFKEGRASLVVMDVNGRPVKTLASGRLPQGQHRIAWNGTDQDNIDTASGVYFYRLETEGGTQTGRMVLVR